MIQDEAFWSGQDNFKGYIASKLNNNQTLVNHILRGAQYMKINGNTNFRGNPWLHRPLRELRPVVIGIKAKRWASCCNTSSTAGRFFVNGVTCMGEEHRRKYVSVARGKFCRLSDDRKRNCESNKWTKNWIYKSLLKCVAQFRQTLEGFSLVIRRRLSPHDRESMKHRFDWWFKGAGLITPDSERMEISRIQSSGTIDRRRLEFRYKGSGVTI